MKAFTLFVVTAATLLICSTPSTLAANNPELKVSIDYGFFESVKMFVVQPAIQDYILNHPINQTIRFNDSSWYYNYDANFSNPTIIRFDLDWSRSHFLTPGPNNGSIIQIRGLNITIALNISITADKLLHTEGPCNFSIFGINADIGLGFSPNPTGDNIYISIPTANIDFDRTEISLDSTFAAVFAKIITFIVNNLSKGTITSGLSKFLTNDISNQLRDLTINKTQFPFKIFNVTLGIPEQPVVYVLPDQNYTNIGFQLKIVNNQTGESSPAFFEEFIADKRKEGQQLQFLVASNMLNQVGWMIQQLNLINLVLSNKDLPLDAPISLNTTALKILIPALSRYYGSGKGIYVALKQTNTAPQFYTRDGRLIGILKTGVEFWVDNDGQNYPDEGLANCTTCVLGLEFNNSLMIELNIYKIDSSHVGLTILNIDMTDLTVLNGEGTDAYELRKGVDNLLKGFIPTINAQVKSGIEIPVIGLFGINDISVGISKNYLSLEISLNHPTEFDYHSIKRFLQSL